MRPMIKYRGGKSKEIPQIMWHIPKFTGRYIEPFFGGGALFFYLEHKRAIINDINTKLMEFYRGVRDDYENLRKELDEIEQLYTRNRRDFEVKKSQNPDVRVEDKNEELYYHLRAMFNDNGRKTYSDALLYYFINKTAYSGMIRYNAKGEFNVPFGRYKQINTKLVTEAHSKLLQHAEIFNTDYKEVFNMCKADDFMFLDPPYDCVFSDYGNEEYKEGFNEENHRQLAKDFAELPCMALMIIGCTPVTETLYKGYIVDEYEKSYAVNIRNRFKAGAKHIVVTNYKKCWDNVHMYSTHYAAYRESEPIQLSLFEAREPYGKNR
ncbi:MAG: Dam family site-specific DNA-(adenine-N6)-methyltransferase [Prevotella sp.]|nr:Dam family site-specific DNA-(adenine-N6)-methyltransferase [Prevotella sp.]